MATRAIDSAQPILRAIERTYWAAAASTMACCAISTLRESCALGNRPFAAMRGTLKWIGHDFSKMPACKSLEQRSKPRPQRRSEAVEKTYENDFCLKTKSPNYSSSGLGAKAMAARAGLTAAAERPWHQERRLPSRVSLPDLLLVAVRLQAFATLMLRHLQSALLLKITHEFCPLKFGKVRKPARYEKGCKAEIA